MADELPWTTSRCNRLLRPISSKLAKLRAEFERPRSAGIDTRSASTAFATKCSPRKTTNFTRPAQKPRGFEKARDPDWRPDGKPTGRGSKKTYGGRGARKEACLQRDSAGLTRVTRPGEIAFTPLVARMSSQLHSSPHVQKSPLKKHGKNRGPLQVNIDWTQLPGDLRKLVQGVSEAYANVLQATTDGDEKCWKGTRSLMAACLRRLPAYIELEEHFAKLDREQEDEDEERDIGGEIYEHLENQFEQRPGNGWRPFKQVLRAHATSLLCDAITDEIVGLDSMSMLVTHCVRVSAWDEAERLLLAYLPLIEAPSIPINIKADLFDAQRSPYLYAVKSFVDHTGRHRLLFDLLEHMIAHELLPLEWLATECMRPVWDRVVRSTSSNDHRTIAHAYRFFEIVTLAGMGLPDERLLADETTSVRRFVPSSREELRLALSTTYSSLLTVMCSIALVNNSRDDDAGRSIARRVTWMLDAVVIVMLSRSNIRSEVQLLEAHQDDAQTFLQRATWTIFASFLVHLDKCPVEASTVSLELSGLVHGLNWLTAQYASNGINIASILGGLPALVSSVARGTGRIWKDDGFDQLQRLVQALLSLSGYRLPHKLWTLKRLALESAVEFAQDMGVSEHHTYARIIEQKMRTQGQLVIVPSPQKHDSPSSAGGGFRWEEGIGEWVACTPGVKRMARKPMTVLELLPTPAQSDDEDALPDDSAIWDTTALDADEDDDLPAQSSPIKKVPRLSVTSLGKRQRAPSPMVLVKRTKLTPPDTPITFYPDLPEEIQDGPRRSRRSTHEIKQLTSRLRTQRSRTSLDSGLRTQQRKTYVEPLPIDASTSEDSDSDSDSVSSDTESLPHPEKPAARHPRGRLPRIQQRTISTSTRDDPDSESESEASSSNALSSPKKLPSRRSKGRPHRALPPYDGAEDERDDLGITPARPVAKRRTSSRNAGKLWWKVRQSVVNDSDDDGSEDELSFH
ncbi:hypothetical protein HBI81_242420 [Parastagonospora nodorum]|nr:hypothetical protein HBI73_219600 [Parastagonospora nodorum]KAH5299508.1 hypothetical protein HBI11_152870 [Parastagonospora nodorum]KAH5341883.1 hypothetical protein HBI33_235360 [Parastagonospora nodorum]KAH5411615.1 hypothetical protein HBI46_159290 [Parastagonospora nodorum]KAH6135718.1 hypothetical protein HBI68_238530 [Parastagonospora nodorum]